MPCPFLPYAERYNAIRKWPTKKTKNEGADIEHQSEQQPGSSISNAKGLFPFTGFQIFAINFGSANARLQQRSM